MAPDPSANAEAGGPGSVGLVGAGRVGQWFVTKLTRAGYEPVVFDVDAEAVADAVDRGGVAAENPAAVTTRADIVVLSLPTREAVETVMEGTDGVLDALEPGQVVLDTGTTPPDVDVYYHEQCHERDAGYLDCPITRHGPGEGDQPQEPAYTMFVGGDPDEYEQVRPVVDALAHEHEFFEGVGNGHVVKLATALRATCRAAVAAEVCEFLANNGVDPRRVVDLLAWDVPDPYVDPPAAPSRGFERVVRAEDEEPDASGRDDGTAASGRGDARDGPGSRVDDSGARPRLAPPPWAKDPAYALAVAHASNTYVPMLTAAYQTVLLGANYGRALLDRDPEFGDDEWHLFHLRSVYRALTRPQTEWHSRSRWSRE